MEVVNISDKIHGKKKDLRLKIFFSLRVILKQLILSIKVRNRPQCIIYDPVAQEPFVHYPYEQGVSLRVPEAFMQNHFLFGSWHGITAGLITNNTPIIFFMFE
ncbi:hypothetical protein [Bacillus sp. mrc49]|uniref:hypothetical protein n=1 Tax=Bacillus sp. mrc49 TaxID=2054913 RepID=UPI000C2721C2|nr:hypothetical protein [Bacillus sp. mrc49]PJN88724.1 hypothetical protein CVN76_17295 [Bacillus sp. mrc49]